MSEIGSGGLTSFPGALDTNATAETAADYVRLNWGRDVETALVAIEAELGVDPAGSYATVVARLDAMMSKGLNSARPAASAVLAGFYYSTDLDILEFSNGTSWRPVFMG